MRKNVIFLCFALLAVIIILSGCTSTQSISAAGPTTTPKIEYVTVPGIPTPKPQIVNVNLPIATPTPQIVYVTVTVPVSQRTTVTVPVSAQTTGETVCNGIEQSTANIRMIGSVYGLASAPEAGIDEIRFTIGLAPCSSALDLTKLQIVYSRPDTPPVTLRQGTRTSTNFFTTKIGTTKVTSLDSDDKVEITFFVDPVSANTRLNIELRPSGGAVLPFTMTAPATISAMNIL